ncbi:MAG: glycosyltransferase family 2 protein [Clostridia bacterium]|nr:glycosyltransferase family 2 protein [Clostridia bacterium]
MKYSVIIPAYNCADTIEETVKSVLNSGLDCFEIIIIDDGSTDPTPKICEALSEKHSEINYIRKENGGVSSARNLGIEAAKGNYLLFMDSDDSYKENALKKVCELCEQHTPDMIIFGLSFDYYKDGSVYRRDELMYPGEGLFTPTQWAENFPELFENNSLSSACNKMFKKQIVKDNGIFFKKDVFLMEDFLFVLDCLEKTDKIYLYPEAIYHYHQPEDEMRVYTRINRVNDINAYLEPFCESMDKLTLSLKNRFNLSFPQGEDVLFRLYKMFLNQKGYYADIEALKALCETHKKSRWVDYKTDDILISDLVNENYKSIIKRHKKIQFRHKIALKVKKTFLYRKLRGN